MRRFIPESVPWFTALTGIVLLGFAGALGYYLGQHNMAAVVISSVRNNDGYQFIDPILYTSVPESIGLPVYGQLKQEITDTVQKATTAGTVSDAGVYFRDLDQQMWIGVNEAEPFAPGSMLKVGLLMTVLRLADANPNLLTTPINVNLGSQYVDDAQDYFPPQDRIQNGQTYTVNALLTHLIIESDNRAVDVLNSYLGTAALDKTLTDLQIPVNSGSLPKDVDSPQQFSRLFRVLYNGSYLPPALSDQALKLLSMTKYTDGLVAGVPDGTTVAHKFGESVVPVDASSTDSGTINELHDCGIVYFPGHPYFLCVMTKGTSDYPELANLIKTISSMTWDYMKQKYP